MRRRRPLLEVIVCSVEVGRLVRRDEGIDENVETARVRALIELLEAGG